jgi:hypothetical protein
MKVTDILVEAKLAAKILQDPKLTKMLSIAVKHDRTIPRGDIAVLGPRASDKEYATLWGNLVDGVLANSNFGDLSRDGKLDAWIIKQYTNHLVDFEELAGEGVDIIGAWKALSIRGLLAPAHQDLNNITSIERLDRIMRDTKYADQVQRIKNAEMLEKHKRTRTEIVLIDNDRFHVIIPLNYGSCYTFNNQTGHMSRFCTGGSDGMRWFNRYAPSGPIVSIVDKTNADNKYGKWQMHAPTDQLVNSLQDNNYRGDQEFNAMFPGLMKLIVSAMTAKAAEIQAGSKQIAPPDGYDVQKAVQEIASTFPVSYTGKPVKADQADLARRIGTVAQPAVAQPAAPTADAAQSAQPATQEPYDWRLSVGERTYPGVFLFDTTPDEARQALQQYAVKNRIPKGRARLVAFDNNDVIVRI